MSNEGYNEYEIISENIYNTNDSSEDKLRILVQSIDVESMIPDRGRTRLTQQVKRIDPDDSLESIKIHPSASNEEFEASIEEYQSQCCVTNSSNINSRK